MRFTAPVVLMPRVSLSDRTRTTSPGGSRLGERVRQLRVAAGLTPTDPAGDRFVRPERVAAGHRHDPAVAGGGRYTRREGALTACA